LGIFAAGIVALLAVSADRLGGQQSAAVRIDDPKAGWKGRGLWSSSGDRAPWLMENGKGSKPLAVHFQLRPDPLAK
jgi:hypothetical protein